MAHKDPRVILGLQAVQALPALMAHRGRKAIPAQSGLREIREFKVR
jgi:hypothetical protein